MTTSASVTARIVQQRLRKLIQESPRTQHEIAEYAGIARSTFARRLKMSECPFTVIQMVMIAAALGVQVESLWADQAPAGGGI